jgi:hypothetical protein
MEKESVRKNQDKLVKSPPIFHYGEVPSVVVDMPPFSINSAEKIVYSMII